MGRPKTKSDAEILAVARRCILEHGAKVSTEHIANEVGLSQPALFKRFGKKRNLVMQALAPPSEPPFADLLRAGPSDDDICEQLKHIGSLMCAFFDEHIPLMLAMRHASIDMHEVMLSMDPPPPLVAQKAMASFFQKAHDKKQLYIINADSAAVTFMGALQSRSFLAHLTNATIDAAEHTDTLVNTLFNGMRPDAKTLNARSPS